MVMSRSRGVVLAFAGLAALVLGACLTVLAYRRQLSQNRIDSVDVAHGTQPGARAPATAQESRAERGERLLLEKLAAYEVAVREGRLNDAQLLLDEARRIELDFGIPIIRDAWPPPPSTPAEASAQLDATYLAAVRRFCEHDYTRAAIAFQTVARAESGTARAQRYLALIYYNEAVRRLQAHSPSEALYYLELLNRSAQADDEARSLLVFVRDYSPQQVIDQRFRERVKGLRERRDGCE